MIMASLYIPFDNLLCGHNAAKHTGMMYRHTKVRSIRMTRGSVGLAVGVLAPAGRLTRSWALKTVLGNGAPAFWKGQAL